MNNYQLVKQIRLLSEPALFKSKSFWRNINPHHPFFQTRYILNDLNPVWDEVFNEDVCHQVCMSNIG
jgi:hypothetical protein